MISQETSTPQVELFGIRLDCVNMHDAVQRIQHWMIQPSGRCRYVVTPNVDHVLLLQENPEFRRAYENADMIVVDGWPLVLASRLLGKPLPQRICGADLVIALLAASLPNRPLRVFLLGAGPGVAERAARRIEEQFQRVCVADTYCPPLGFEDDEQQNRTIRQHIEAAEPDLLVVGLGAPKQENWVHRHREQLRASVAVCAGATIDFLAGEKPRAPRWMRRVGLEWCHRMLTEPRRLVPRYTRDALLFPPIFVREWLGAKRNASSSD